MQPDCLVNANRSRHSAVKLAIIGLAALAAAAPQAWAQAKKPDFATIRKTELATIDRNNVEAWINSQIQQMFAAQNDQTLQAQGREFVDTITQNARAADATPKFKDGVATILADSFVAQYPKAPANRRPLAAVYPLMALNQLAQPTPKMIDAFTLGLSEPTSGARLLGATGLLTVKAQLNQQQWTALVPVLQKVGSAETNGPTLARIYRLLALPANAPVDSSAAVLAILEARLGRIEQKKGLPMAADAEAIQWLGERFPTLTNPQVQDKAILLIARMLTNTVYAYVNKPAEPQLAPYEKVIMTAEAELKKAVTRRAPNAKASDLTKAMLDNGPSQANAMLLALNAWIGTAQQAGTLNAAPFNFEKGLKIAPPPAASQPAAAATAK